MASLSPHEPESEPPVATRLGGRDDAGTSGFTRRTACLAGLLLAVVLAWSVGLLERTAFLGVQFFEYYAQSQLAMLQAADNVADGRAEYAVLLDQSAGIEALKADLEAMADIRYERESALPGWAVVSVADGDRGAVKLLKSAASTRLVVPNRGLWICH